MKSTEEPYLLEWASNIAEGRFEQYRAFWAPRFARALLAAKQEIARLEAERRSERDQEAWTNSTGG